MLESALKIAEGWWRQWFPIRCPRCRSINIDHTVRQHFMLEGWRLFKCCCRSCGTPFKPVRFRGKTWK